jgi:CheY-like chemotaxis protein
MSVKALRILKWGCYLACLAWIGAATWYIFLRDQPPDLAWQAFERSIEHKINDCTGSFGERYECKSALVRQEKVALFYWWAERVSIILAPAFGLLTVLFFYFKIIARKTEEKRVAARLQRIDFKAMEARQRAIDESRRRAELARLREEAKRRAAAQIKHILIVDRDATLTQRLRVDLTGLGYEVAFVDSLESALLNFKESAFDLVMIDIFQEGMGGLNAIEKLNATGAECKIIAMSSGFCPLSEEDMVRAAAKIGAVQLLTKPLDYASLPAILDCILVQNKGLEAAQPDGLPLSRAAGGT